MEFESVVDEETGIIKNVYRGTTYQNVKKIWKAPGADDNLVEVDPGDNATVTVDLHRDSAHVGTITFGKDRVITKEFDDELGTEVEAEVSKDHPWYLEITGLPEYSEADGARYSYVVIERPVSGWHTEREYDADNHLTTITNTLGVGGPETDIPVAKIWLDGADDVHRLPSVVGVFAKRDVTDTKSGIGIVENQFMGYVVLTADHGWYGELTVPGKWNWENDFRIEELGLADDTQGFASVPVSEGQDDNAALQNVKTTVVKYRTYEASEASTNLDLANEEWAQMGWSEAFPGNDKPRIPTGNAEDGTVEDGHVYEVAYPEDEDDGMLPALDVSNRRIGIVDLTISKEWLDDGKHERPEAWFSLTATGENADFSVDVDGKIYITLDGGNKLPLYSGDNENTPLEGIVLKDGKQLSAGEDGGDELRIKVDAMEAADEGYADEGYRINGLPKYNAQGVVANYELKEVMADNGASGADRYVSTVEEGAYTPGADRHFHDKQEYAFTNTLTGVKDVVFHKIWKDAYVNNVLHQRPDIYLTLYTLGENGKPQAVESYVQYQREVDDTSNPYDQNCVISNLPKFDSQGKEIIYYATESTSADAKALDYTPVTLTAPASSPTGYSPILSTEGKTPDQMDSGEKVEGSNWMVVEDGTFTNAISAPAIIEGFKLWQNIPYGFDLADLPQISIYLQQRLDPSCGETHDWPNLEAVQPGSEPTDGYAEVPGQEGWYVKGAIAWANLTQDSTNPTTQWSFEMKHEGLNDPDDSEASNLPELPKYDENGNLYEYRTREGIWGLVDTDGGFVMGQLSPDDEGPGTTDDLTAGIYKVDHGASGSYLLGNSYDPEESALGKLTVKKIFADDNRESGDSYPDVTFTVYRQYAKNDGSMSTPVMVATHTIAGKEFEGGKGAEGVSSTLMYTFENLEKFAPNGKAWQYIVAEESINGYTTTVNVGNLELGQVTGSSNSSLGVDGVVSDRMDYVPIETDDGKKTDVNEQFVTFANTYAPGTASFIGTKAWNDYGGLFAQGQTRPDITLTVTRVSEAGAKDEAWSISFGYPPPASCRRMAGHLSYGRAKDSIARGPTLWLVLKNGLLTERDGFITSRRIWQKVIRIAS